MTEEEAKTKWCPFVRAINGKIKADGSSEHDNRQGSYNRIIDGGANWVFPMAGACIASGCMAWRRQTVMIDRATNEPAVPGKAALGDLELRYSAHGYCGLAGAPQ